MPLFRRSKEPTDPLAALDRSALPARLVPIVDDAVAAAGRWRQLLDGMREGAIRDRLGDIGRRIDGGVIELHATAARVGDLDRALAALDPRAAADAYKRAKRNATSGEPAPPELAALEARFTSTQRLLNLVEESEQQLRLIDARLAAAVARGTEVAFTARDDDVAAIDADLTDVLDELTAVHHALNAVN